MKLTLILSSMFLACSFIQLLHAQTVQQLQAEITQLKTLQAQVTALQGQVAQLKASPVQQLAPFVYVDYNPENGVAAPNVVFHGANIHIVSGSGATDDHELSRGVPPNGPLPSGRGNLIIGYNEMPTNYVNGDRGGSHNVVMGMQNKFNTWAWSGFVNGQGNLIGQQESVILTGTGNTVSGHLNPNYGAYSVVITGGGNRVFDGLQSVIVGGAANDIEYIGDVILGGSNNGAGGVYDTVLGGYNNGVNHATGDDQDIIVPAFNSTGALSNGIHLPVLQ
jgi:hypothetical protein